MGLNHYGAERPQSDAQKAERMVKAELERRGWGEADLHTRRKGDPRKVSIARRLRQEIPMSLKRIATRLDMGSWTYVSNPLPGPPPDAASAQRQPLLCQ